MYLSDFLAQRNSTVPSNTKQGELIHGFAPKFQNGIVHNSSYIMSTK